MCFTGGSKIQIFLNLQIFEYMLKEAFSLFKDSVTKYIAERSFKLQKYHVYCNKQN